MQSWSEDEVQCFYGMYGMVWVNGIMPRRRRRSSCSVAFTQCKV